ncbi:pyridoxamine 5'-phosphate oxidase family protein [Saccharopolyspora sp. TS4A08]|uniref:Pyridoxamine 5'-phosphate oxidase family protein n=1 Tax=Saccharopolyspora ipomoeae TaxID=3042027 RepID=A0ABT6PIE4_9PSEU|nr:pyridoxamine 5'-phosphate oxidase family protein [Saccharopolyspora sp. TS4A08]MDI2027771.1 pyridoxamine 5'-phosphate oxidase family protein [Saccharopolyspora sp. TS4A08]
MGIDDLENLRSVRGSSDDIDELIQAQTEAVVSFTSDTGWASGVVMSYVRHDGAFWVTAVSDRAHAKAFRRDPRISLVISATGTPLAGRRMVSVRCLAHAHVDEVTRHWFYRALGERISVEDPDAFFSLLDSENRAVFELRPVRVAVSHDSRKLPGDGRGGSAP